jgi:hypothetical protein
MFARAGPYPFAVDQGSSNNQLSDRRFVCQSSSISFLASHNFDFNKLFYKVTHTQHNIAHRTYISYHSVAYHYQKNATRCGMHHIYVCIGYWLYLA